MGDMADYYMEGELEDSIWWASLHNNGQCEQYPGQCPFCNEEEPNV